ncbi:MAG: flavin reductase [Planctomycetota bacterium]|jgi:flavin reductase (DIM6/NTAB) family NADH-FMN oxidoreductase RutF/uncharacterized damage-inducible protein DinB
MRIDPNDRNAVELYRLMISVIVPRPIAWVSTRGPDGALNAAPFSYFQALSSKPPTVMVSIGRKRGGESKDTLRNIEETGEFVVNIVSEESGERMVRTSEAYDYGVSEFEKVGLEAAPSEIVKPPRIAESAVSMECRLDRVLEVGTSGVVLGQVVLFHLRDDVLGEDGNVDPARLRPLGRLGGSNYAPLREVLSITTDRPAVAESAEIVALWRELRDRSIAMVRSLEASHLAHTLGEGGMSVGRIFRHLAGCTTWLRLMLAGREDEDEMKEWDSSWTPDRIAGELEQDREEFIDAMRSFLPQERDKLGRMIRHEAWHQGQIAAALRAEFDESKLWFA